MYTHFNILLKFNAFRFVRFFLLRVHLKSAIFGIFNLSKLVCYGVVWCGAIQLHTLPLISQIDFNYNVFLSRPFYFFVYFSISFYTRLFDCENTHTQTKTKVEKKTVDPDAI